MDNAWNTFEPSARMNCAIRARLFVRSDPTKPIYPAEDLEMGIAFAGATIRPSFFPITLTELAGQVTYAKGRVELKNFRAKRGQADIRCRRPRELAERRPGRSARSRHAFWSLTRTFFPPLPPA
jgi:hypothetical protein